MSVRNVGLWLIPGLVALLSACNDNSDAAPASSSSAASPSTATISGYAATGRAIPTGSVVRVRCRAGSAETTTASDGSYRLAAAALTFPCMLQASFGSGEARQLLHSFAATASTTQITPLTHASVARALAGSDPAAVFSAPTEAQLQTLATQLPAAQLLLRELLTAQGLATPLAAVAGDFFTATLVPATASNTGDSHDRLLDAVATRFGVTDALAFTLVNYVPGATLPPPPPPSPSSTTGLEISPAPITLGALSTSFTTDEVVAATRMVSITNHGPESRSIGPYFRGYQDGIITSTQIADAPYEVENRPACFYGRTLAVGDTCWVRLYWKPGNLSQGVPLTGNLQGTFGVQVPNTATDLVNTSVSASLVPRSYIVGATTLFMGTSGYKARNLITLRNEGDVTGSYSITVYNQSSTAGAFYEDPTRPGQKTCDGNLAPGESCTIPYAFCWSSALGEDERIRATLTVEGESVNTTIDLLASNRQSEPPKLCGGIFDES